MYLWLECREVHYGQDFSGFIHNDKEFGCHPGSFPFSVLIAVKKYSLNVY